MAKIKLGQVVAQASGSVGGTVFSRNRFGPYIRNRSIPVQPESGKQLARRAALSAASAQWSTLVANVRKAWLVWAQNNPIVDALGDKRTLDGHQAFTMLATRLLGWGWNMPTTPPIIPVPVEITGVSMVASAATGEVTYTFAPTPLAANCHLWISGCKTPTASVNYIKNLLRWMDSSNAAQTSTYVQTNFGTIAGTLVSGDNLIARVAVCDHTTGLLSVPRECRVICGA